ncbi:glycosyltransferase [Parabacteroides chongii]|uniref:glycosyltransferase n=1 Tax=Parabacteroides chongii TaxID=2685834 RepID=UPI00240E42DE|nr:glycosyltransferase [Parabacteroides chongii]WFE83115.1 glycosyltransferase [Parabacteroides chongii]
MKKVLIICDLFPPAFGPRMGYLCKYLGSYGWEPVVLTEAVEENTFTFLANKCEVAYVNYYTAKGRFTRKLQWISTLLLDLCFGYKDIRMYKEAEKLVKRNKFDLVLCSSFRTFPLPAARKVARKHQLPLVVDLRDIIEQYTGNEFISHPLPSFLGLNKLFVSVFKRKSLRDRNRVLRQADFVTTISPWHVNMLKQYNPNVELIYNGFDSELFYPEQRKTDQFIITYTGRLLSTAMRDPGLFLEALRILSEEKVLTVKDCRVYWYVDEASWKIITEEAEKQNVLPYMDFKGYVPASDIPSVLNSSSVLLLLTNRATDSGPKGIMTTKFFESLAVEKPILCVRSDESHLAEAIKETNAGLAATNVNEVCDFLKSYYLEWKEKGYASSSIKKDKLIRFSRKEQAKQFIEIFEKAQIHG